MQRAWRLGGVATALSLAVLLHAIQVAGLSQIMATALGAIAGIGAVIGGLCSRRLASRRWIVACYLVLAGLIAAIPWTIIGPWSMAGVMLAIGFTAMAPCSIVDAWFLARAHREGLSGLGGTILSLVHNIFILGIGLGLVALLASGAVTATTQFLVLAGCSVTAALIAIGIRQPASDESLTTGR